VCPAFQRPQQAARSLSGMVRERPGARLHRSKPIPCRGGRKNARSRKTLRRLSRSRSPRASPSADQREVLPTEAMTKAQNEIRYPSPYHEPNTGSDGFDASVEVSWSGRGASSQPARFHRTCPRQRARRQSCRSGRQYIAPANIGFDRRSTWRTHCPARPDSGSHGA
jgi:hypothetical protein